MIYLRFCHSDLIFIWWTKEEIQEGEDERDVWSINKCVCASYLYFSFQRRGCDSLRHNPYVYFFLVFYKIEKRLIIFCQVYYFYACAS